MVCFRQESRTGTRERLCQPYQPARSSACCGPSTTEPKADTASAGSGVAGGTPAFPGADALLGELAGSEFPVSSATVERLRDVYAHLATVSPDSPEFERYLREDVIEHGVFTRSEAVDIVDSVLDASARHKGDVALLVPFFVAFEWFHRREFDARQRAH